MQRPHEVARSLIDRNDTELILRYDHVEGVSEVFMVTAIGQFLLHPFNSLGVHLVPITYRHIFATTIDDGTCQVSWQNGVSRERIGRIHFCEIPRLFWVHSSILLDKVGFKLTFVLLFHGRIIKDIMIFGTRYHGNNHCCHQKTTKNTPFHHITHFVNSTNREFPQIFKSLCY